MSKKIFKKSKLKKPQNLQIQSMQKMQNDSDNLIPYGIFLNDENQIYIFYYNEPFKAIKFQINDLKYYYFWENELAYVNNFFNINISEEGWYLRNNNVFEKIVEDLILNEDIIKNSDIYSLLYFNILFKAPDLTTFLKEVGNSIKIAKKDTSPINALNFSTEIKNMSNNENLIDLIEKDIKNITIPENTEIIGPYAFSNCSELETIYFTKNQKEIKEYAFLNCKKLYSIVIPEKIEKIEANAFKGCDNLTIYCEVEEKPVGWDENWNPDNRPVIWASASQIIVGSFKFEIKNFKAYLIENISSETTIEIPNEILFENSIIPVVSISSDAFSENLSLESITIPSNIQMIEENAFINCSSLENVYYNGTIENWCNIIFSNEYSNPMSYAEHFYMLNENDIWYEPKSFIISSNDNIIKKYQFYNFKKIEIIEINGIVIIEEGAFWNCSNLTKILIPTYLENISSNVFKSCDNLTIYCEVESKPDTWDENWNPDNRPVVWNNFEFIISNLIEYTPKQYVANTLKVVKNHNESKNIIIPDTINYRDTIYDVKLFGLASFKESYYLETISVPMNVEEFEEDVFQNCENLINVSFNKNPRLVFWGGTFTNCKKLKTINFPSGLDTISENKPDFFGCESLESITVEEGGNYISIDGVLYHIGGFGTDVSNEILNQFSVPSNSFFINLVCYPPGKKDEVFDFHHDNEDAIICSLENLFSLSDEEMYFFVLIETFAFKSCYNLKILKLHERVISFPIMENCPNLEVVLFSNPTISSDNNFLNCPKLRKLEMGTEDDTGRTFLYEKIDDLGNKYFGFTNRCLIENGNLYSNTFKSYSADNYIEEKVLVAGPTYFPIDNEEKIIDNCRYELYDNNTAVFLGTTLINAIIPEKVLFNNVEYTVVEVAAQSCQDNKTLTTISFPDTVLRIGKKAFYNCENLREIVLPQNLYIIGDYCFYGCISLEKISLPQNIFHLEKSLFENCTSLNDVLFGGDLVVLEESVFRNCTSLQQIELPPSTCKIKNSCFFGCVNLEKVDVVEIETGENFFNVGIFQLGNSVFSSCKKLKTFELSENIIKINSSLFYDCESLESLILPSNLNKIESNSFYNCVSLKNIYYRGTIEQWCGINIGDILNYAGSAGNPMYYAQHFYILNSDGIYIEAKNFVINDTITKIGNNQFYGFDYAESFDLPETIETIGNYSFALCTNLQELTIPSSVISIGNYGLVCGSEEKPFVVIFNASVPPELGYRVFGSDSGFLKNIVVLDEYLDDYKTKYSAYIDKIIAKSQYVK